MPGARLPGSRSFDAASRHALHRANQIPRFLTKEACCLSFQCLHLPTTGYAMFINHMSFSVMSQRLLSQPQALLDILPHDLLVLIPLVPPHLRSIDIRRALVVRLGQHAHHADQDLLDALDRRPALGCLLVLHRVVAGRVQDRYTDFAVVVYCFSLASLLTLQTDWGGINVPLGCHTSVRNFIFGGARG